MVPSLENSYSGEGSLQANKTSKKQNLNLKQYKNKGTSKRRAISLTSYLSEKRKAAINQ